MQFKREQVASMQANWNSDSWFYQNIGPIPRAIVETAYFLNDSTSSEVAKCQESLTLIMSVFARRIGAEKSQVVHALLTGEVFKLLAAIGRKKGGQFSVDQLREEWEASFRDVGFRTL